MYVSVAVLSLCLVGLVLIQLRWAIAFLRWPVEIMYGEALIQDHAARILRGEALYQPLGHPSYTVASYTPLFYVLMAATQAVGGPGLLAGRFVSVVATVVTAALLGRLAAGQGRGVVAGALAGLLFVAFGFPTPFPWFALAKEDVLGVAFGVGSIAVLVSGRDRPRVVVSGLLAAMAILTKQPLIAALVAGLVSLWLCDRRRVLLFGLASVGPVLAVVAASELSTHAFLANTVFANVQPFRVDVLLTSLAGFKAYQAGPVALTAVAVVRRLYVRKSFEDILLPAYCVVSALPLLGLASVGSAQNYWIELAAATSVLAASEIWWWLRGPDLRSRLVGAALALVPLVNVVVAGRLALIWLPALAQYADPAGTQAEFAAVLERVRSTPGEVVAEPLDALALAGKPALVEPWAADALYQSGTWDIGPLVDRVCNGDIQLAVLAHALDDSVVAYQDYGIWPAPLIDALRQKMVLQGTRAGRYLYIPLPGSRCANRT
jgi:type IV secretory pathway TrbD component